MVSVFVKIVSGRIYTDLFKVDVPVQIIEAILLCQLRVSIMLSHIITVRGRHRIKDDLYPFLLAEFVNLLKDIHLIIRDLEHFRIIRVHIGHIPFIRRHSLIDHISLEIIADPFSFHPPLPNIVVLDKLRPVFGVFRDTDDVRIKAALMFTQVMCFPENHFDRLRPQSQLDRIISFDAFLQIASHYIRSDAVIPVHFDRGDRDVSQAVSHIENVDLTFRFFLYSRDPAIAVREIAPEIPIPSAERKSEKPDYYDNSGHKACDLNYVLHLRF